MDQARPDQPPPDGKAGTKPENRPLPTRAELPRADSRPEVRPDLIPNPAVRRLSLYPRQLESFKRKDRRTISSRQLGERLGVTDAQGRKDLADFGQVGHPGIWYGVDYLIAQVKRSLGTDK